jgi:hypothetical protein
MMMTEECNEINQDINRDVVQYLLGLDDDKFEHIYFNTINYNDDESELDDDELELNYDQNVCAILTNQLLIKKCLNISKVQMNLLIEQLPCNNHICVNIELDSCKLLHDAGCNMAGLLLVVHKYECIKYIIDNMTDIDIADILSDYKFLNSSSNIMYILIIDRIRDKYLISLCKHILFIGPSPPHQHLTKINNITKCYFIVKHMTKGEGKKYLSEENKLLLEHYAIT